MRQYDELNRIQNQASGEALKQLDRLWPAVESMAPGDARDMLLDVTPGLIDRWGSVTGAASAEWYETAREKALGSPGEAKLAELDAEAVEGSVRWAARGLFTPGFSGQARARLGDVIDRNVRNMGRSTLAKSINADRADVRWARMMNGSETCPWCRMLASRGFVYKSKQRAGGDHTWGHDNCYCQVVPDFALNDAEHDLYDAEVTELYEQYTWAGSQIPGAGQGVSPNAQAIAKEWRRHIIDYDTAAKQLALTRAGSSGDGSIDIPAWDHARRDLVKQLETDYPDGFAYGRRLVPRNPAQVPKEWPSDMPAMDAETWNRVLYGHDGSGGYMAGHGWANSDPADPFELPEDWDSARIANELQQTIEDGALEDSGDGETYNRTTSGYSISIRLGLTEDGARFVRDVLIT